MHQLAKKAQEQKPSALKRTVKSGLPSVASNDPALQLQQTIGNHGVLRRAGPVIQPKLMIGPANDKYEQEADCIADLVMRMPEPKPLRRKLGFDGGAESEECDTCQKKPLTVQRLSHNETGLSSVPPIVDEVLRSPGQPLDSETRAFMEPRFGYDFSHVQVHTDAKAAESARAINAAAYTVGRNVVFGEGHYLRHSVSGRSLLAHELAHVVQQGGRTETSAQQTMIAEDDLTEVILAVNATTVTPALARQELPGPISLPEESMCTPETLIEPSLRGRAALSIALGEVGVRENPSASNRGACVPGAKRGCVDAYTGGRHESWCAHFVSWAFEQTGYSPFGHRAAVSSLRNWGHSQGRFIEQAKVGCGLFVPQAGDIFTMKRYQGSGHQRRLVGGHTGFVIRYDPVLAIFETVEGNNADRVVMGERTLSEVDGFIRI